MSLTASGNIGSPPVSPALDGGQHAVAQHKGADVTAAVGNELLNVVDGALNFQGLEDPVGHLLTVNAHHAQSHRAEQRLDNYVAP